MGKGLFVTATGTDAGKTWVSALIVKKLRTAGLSAGYYKAALSGAVRESETLIPGDAEFVRVSAQLEENAAEMVSYVYERAFSPHLAARLEGNSPSLKQIRADYKKKETQYDFVTVEGSGGIVCPIRYDDQEKILLEDIIHALQLPSLIVAPAGLGTINATVLTVEYMRSRNLPIKGIILNHYHEDDVMEADNRKMIERLTGCPVVALVAPHAATLDIEIDTLTGFYS